jgi:hypothetical protein
MLCAFRFHEVRPNHYGSEPAKPNLQAVLKMPRPHRPGIRPIFRISENGQEPITDVNQVEAIEHAIHSIEPGRYHVEAITADPLPSGHNSRRWGVGIKRVERSIALESDQWDA